MTKRAGTLIKNIFLRLDMCSLYVAQAVRCCPLPLEPRVRVSVTPYGLRGRNRVCVGFLGVSLVFPYHKFHSTIFPHSSHSFCFIRPCDGASGVIWRHPCYSQTLNKGASSHLIPRPGSVSDTSWGYIQLTVRFYPQVGTVLFIIITIIIIIIIMQYQRNEICIRS